MTTTIHSSTTNAFTITTAPSSLGEKHLDLTFRDTTGAGYERTVPFRKAQLEDAIKAATETTEAQA